MFVLLPTLIAGWNSLEVARSTELLYSNYQKQQYQIPENPKACGLHQLILFESFRGIW